MCSSLSMNTDLTVIGIADLCKIKLLLMTHCDTSSFECFYEWIYSIRLDACF